MATKYISPTGNDTTGDGSYATPWATPQKFNTSTTTNDVLIFKNGTYTMTTANFDMDYARTYQAETNGSVILDGAAADMFLNVGAAGLTINIVGLIFQNVTRTTQAAILKLTGALFNTTFTLCIFRDSQLSTTANLKNGGFLGMDTTYRGTLSLNKCVFEGLTSSGTAPYCIQFDSESTAASVWTVTITNCVAYLTSATMGGFFGSASGGSGGTAAASTFTWKNNIFYTSNAQTLLLKAGNVVITGTYNYNDRYGSWTLSSYSAGANDITTDPLFVDAANSDFRLRQTSPCLDTGELI